MNIKRISILTVLSLITFSSCKEEVKEKKAISKLVKYTSVDVSSANKIRTFSGTVLAGDAIGLSFRNSGVITKVNHWKGDKVKKGAIIAKLDNVEANLAYQKSVSALKSAKYAMNTAKSNVDRIKSLYEKGSNSLSDYESARNSYQTALDQHETAITNKNIQATQLSYGVIKAPKDGVIAGTDGGVGERVSAGHQFAVLNAGKELKIEVGLPENIVNKVTVGMKTTLKFSALGERIMGGTVIEMSPGINSESKTYTTSIGIDLPIKEIKPGMASNVTFDFSDGDKINEKSLIIPVKAVGEDGKGRYVFLINSDDQNEGTVSKRYIELEELTTDGFKVKTGLEKGDLIVIAGLQSLLNGQNVRLKQ